MQRIFKLLPDDVITTIFEYYDPYKTRYDRILYDLRWNQIWYSCFRQWFVTRYTDYKSYILYRNRNNSGCYLQLHDK